MDDDSDQSRLFLLMVVVAFWAAAAVYSIYFLIFVEPAGDGFTRGLNRASGFWGWQGVAWLFALAAWGIGRGFPKASGIRAISRVPGWISLFAIAGLTVIVLTHIR